MIEITKELSTCYSGCDLIVSEQQISTATSKILQVPGDKSISHRVLLAAAITPKPTRLHNLNLGNAVNLLIPALDALGVQVSREEGVVIVSPPINNVWNQEEVHVNLGPSSAAARLLIGLLVGLGVRAVVDGDKTLRTRPMDWVVEPLQKLGADIHYLGEPGCLPVVLKGGCLQDGIVQLRIGSAQARSAVLFAAFASERSVKIFYPIRSRDHTIRLFQYLGMDIQDLPGSVQIQGKCSQHLPEYHIPGDPSAAAFLAAAHIFQRRQTELILENICLNPTRIGFFEVLKECGIQVDYRDVRNAFGETVGTIVIRKISENLKPFQIKDSFLFHSLIDEIPLLVALAAIIPGQSSIFGAEELVFKETNRLLSSRNMLLAFGGQAKVVENSIHITGGLPLQAGIIHSFGDHRIAMTAAALAFSLPGSSKILLGECYKTSFPEFPNLMSLLGLNISHSK
nr:hypothetical protein [Nostoc sp. EkiNYC01]